MAKAREYAKKVKARRAANKIKAEERKAKRAERKKTNIAKFAAQREAKAKERKAKPVHKAYGSSRAKTSQGVSKSGLGASYDKKIAERKTANKKRAEERKVARAERKKTNVAKFKTQREAKAKERKEKPVHKPYRSYQEGGEVGQNEAIVDAAMKGQELKSISLENIPTTNASDRSESYQLGGAVKPPTTPSIQPPQYKKGGKVNVTDIVKKVAQYERADKTSAKVLREPNLSDEQKAGVSSRRKIRKELKKQKVAKLVKKVFKGSRKK